MRFPFTTTKLLDVGQDSNTLPKVPLSTLYHRVIYCGIIWNVWKCYCYHFYLLITSIVSCKLMQVSVQNCEESTTTATTIIVRWLFALRPAEASLTGPKSSRYKRSFSIEDCFSCSPHVPDQLINTQGTLFPNKRHDVPILIQGTKHKLYLQRQYRPSFTLPVSLRTRRLVFNVFQRTSANYHRTSWDFHLAQLITLSSQVHYHIPPLKKCARHWASVRACVDMGLRVSVEPRRVHAL